MKEPLEELIVKVNKMNKRLNRAERVEANAFVKVTDYTATSSIVGWSSFTVKTIWYKVEARLVYVLFHLAGTSNSTSVTFTLPYTSHASEPSLLLPIAIVNNGTAAVGLLTFNGSASTVTCQPTISGGTWTASGTKRVVGQFWYHPATFP